jgi:hypothetical protein
MRHKKSLIALRLGSLVFALLVGFALVATPVQAAPLIVGDTSLRMCKDGLDFWASSLVGGDFTIQVQTPGVSDVTTVTLPPGGVRIPFSLKYRQSVAVGTGPDNGLISAAPPDFVFHYPDWSLRTQDCLIFSLDDRINSDAFSGPVALYCTDGNGLEVWDIDPVTGAGTLAFTFSGSFETPTTNALLMKAGDIELWQLDTGEFQVNADAGEGKTYVFVFNGCPYDGNGYTANLDPNQQ